MYLIDTNVISEGRKGVRANAGVQEFFKRTAEEGVPVFLSVVTRNEADFIPASVRTFNPFV